MKSITRFTKNIRGNKCLNCENDISEEDNFCSRCGQVNDLKKVSLKQYLAAYFDDFLSFDNRFLKTVIPLIFKPGKVTKEYIEGRRIKYVNPFQLYLHITILFFLVVGIFTSIDQFKPSNDSKISVISELNDDEGKMDLDSLKNETIKELKKADIPIDSATISLISNKFQNIDGIKDSLGNKKVAPDEKESLILHFTDSIITESSIPEFFSDENTGKVEKDSIMAIVLKSVDDKLDSILIGKNTISMDWTDSVENWADGSSKERLKNKAIEHIEQLLKNDSIDYEIPIAIIQKSDMDETDNNGVRTMKKVKYFMEFQKEEPKTSVQNALDILGFEKNYWNVFLYTKSSDINEVIEDPDNYLAQFIDRMISRISVALFFLLPVFTIVVSLLYIRRKYNYTENLVFVFHVQTVFFLLLLIFFIVGRIADSEAVILIFLLTFMIYLYKAMRNFYEQGWFKTFIKYIILNSAFMFLSVIGAVIIAFIAFLFD